jgi:hypothetical protein
MAWVIGRCWRCGAKSPNPLARYCTKCGVSLVAQYELSPARAAEQSAWKSIPMLVRLGIWLIVLPPLLWISSCAACTLIAALSNHP